MKTTNTIEDIKAMELMLDEMNKIASSEHGHVFSCFNRNHPASLLSLVAIDAEIEKVFLIEFIKWEYIDELYPYPPTFLYSMGENFIGNDFDMIKKAMDYTGGNLFAVRSFFTGQEMVGSPNLYDIYFKTNSFNIFNMMDSDPFSDTYDGYLAHRIYGMCEDVHGLPIEEMSCGALVYE